MSEQFGFWFACVVLIAVVAGGCEQPGAGEFNVSVRRISTGMYEVTMLDGTRCIMTSSGGITCDWEAK